ncbi:MAG: hypothetical protein AB7F86_15925 [Bdellovibrionales bacterium]
MSKRSFRRGISFAVSLSLLLISPAPLVAQDKNRLERLEAIANFQPDFNLPGLQAQDPMFKKFAEGPWQAPKWGPFDAQDPLLDQDPFFMRSQSYQRGFTNTDSGSTAFRTTRGGIEIQVPGSTQSLVIDQPLAPLFEFENFLIFQSTDPELFSKKTLGDEYAGEGLFFLDKRYLYLELRKNSDMRPVPIFFIPTPGKGWTGKIHRLAVGPNTTFAFRTETGEHTTLDLTQLSQLRQLLHNNVIITTLMALKSDIKAIRELRAKWLRTSNKSMELPFVYPPRGSTAGFGLFVTGANLDNPEAGLFPVRGGRASWNLDLLPKAHAFDLLSADVLQRLMIVGSVTSTAGVIGWIAQYTGLRKRMLERRAYIESKEDLVAAKEGKPAKDRTGVWFKTKREAKEIVDVFSHSLATLSSGFGVGLGFIMEYGADKYFGRQGYSPHGWLRWFLQKTFLYSRKANEMIGANWQTFFLGVVILGGIDTLSVGLQLLFVSPIFFPWVGSFISPEAEAKAIHDFSGNDPTTNNNVTSELMRNLTGYFVSGAYSYSSSQRLVLLEIVQPEVEKQMRSEGKDIHDPKFKKEYEKRLETRLELMLVERGLPTNKEFLFGGPSLIRMVAHMMGYKVDRAKLYGSKDFKRVDESQFLTDEEKAVFQDQKELERKVSSKLDELMKLAAQYPENHVENERFIKNAEVYKRSIILQLEKTYDNESFILENARWGLVGHSLKRALGAAMDLAAQEPDNERLKDTIQILQDLKQKFSFVTNAIKRPWRIGASAREAYQVRQTLTVLSYEDGVVGTGIKYLDLIESAKTKPEATLIAGRLFRQSLLSMLQDRPEFVQPSEKSLEKYLPEARKEAEKLIEAEPGVIGYDQLDREIVALEVVKKKVLDDERKERARAWRPESPDILDRAQREHAHREGLKAVLEQSTGLNEIDPIVERALESGDSNLAKVKKERPLTQGEQYLLDHPESIATYREAYRKSMAEQVGLSAYPEQESQLVRESLEAAQKEIDLNLENNEGWKEYLHYLDEIDRIRFVTHQYADTFLTKYVEKTVSNSSSVDLISPEQPGFFQKVRQWSILQPKVAEDGAKLSWADRFKNKVKRSVTVALRGLESPMDATAYRPGLDYWARRNIPWWQDGKTTLFSSFRMMWTSMTIGYVVQYNIWQVKFAWPAYLFFFWTAGLTSIIHYWTDRLMMNMGVRPMATTWGKVKYSLLYTWLTYPTYIPFFFFVKDFVKWWDQWITIPLSQFIAPVVNACEKLLSALF